MKTKAHGTEMPSRIVPFESTIRAIVSGAILIAG
jgi:hypothetical protein